MEVHTAGGNGGQPFPTNGHASRLAGRFPNQPYTGLEGSLSDDVTRHPEQLPTARQFHYFSPGQSVPTTPHGGCGRRPTSSQQGNTSPPPCEDIRFSWAQPINARTSSEGAHQTLAIGPGFTSAGTALTSSALRTVAQGLGDPNHIYDETITDIGLGPMSTGNIIVTYRGTPKVSQLSRLTQVGPASIRVNARAGTWFSCKDCLAFTGQECRCYHHTRRSSSKGKGRSNPKRLNPGPESQSASTPGDPSPNLSRSQRRRQARRHRAVAQHHHSSNSDMVVSSGDPGDSASSAVTGKKRTLLTNTREQLPAVPKDTTKITQTFTGVLTRVGTPEPGEIDETLSEGTALPQLVGTALVAPEALLSESLESAPVADTQVDVFSPPLFPTLAVQSSNLGDAESQPQPSVTPASPAAGRTTDVEAALPPTLPDHL